MNREEERQRLDLEMEHDETDRRWARFAEGGEGLVTWRRKRSDEPEVTT